jgi:hypothetical protein
MSTKLFLVLLLTASLFYISCAPVKTTRDASATADHQQIFWNNLTALCGRSFEGTVVNAPANDTVFRNKKLVMHVRSCVGNSIRVPFVAGDDLSRTWVFVRNKANILLQHDHRHSDGRPDSITLYGGATVNSGSITMQAFPADQHTANILPAAAMNVWWVELIPGVHFSYNLRRMGTDRLFSIRFDLSREVASPPSPWGWKDR